MKLRSSQERLNDSLLLDASNNETNRMEHLVRHGAAVNTKSTSGLTPLHYAAMYGNPEMIALLLKLGADIEAKEEHGWAPLYLAASNGRTEAVAALLNLGAAVNAKDNNRETPLHRAAQRGEAEMVAALLKRGADIKAKDNNGWTPLHWAARWGKTENVALLLKRGADIEAKDNEGKTPLHFAAGNEYTDKEAKVLVYVKEHTATVAKLLEFGAAVNAKDKNGKTPLHCAVRWGKTETVAALLNLGAAVNAKDNNGWTPLHWAAQYGGGWGDEKCRGMVAALLERGADIEAKSNDGKTPLFYAEARKYTEIVKLLKNWSKDKKSTDKVITTTLEKQSNKEVTSLTNPSPLKRSAEANKPPTPPLSQPELPKVTEEIHPISSSLQASEKAQSSEKLSQEQLDEALLEAAKNGEVNKIDDLVQQGADIEAKIKYYGNTLLHSAAWHEKTETVAKLIELGADIKAKGTDGNTLLHTAAAIKSTEIFDKLIELGADIKAKGNLGKTPLHIAAKYGRMVTIAKLLELGADIEAKDNLGKTPLHIAAECGNTQTVDRLLESGAEKEARNNAGETPLHSAAGSGSVKTVATLLEFGANIKVTNNHGKTPLDIAKKKNFAGLSPEIESLLIKWEHKLFKYRMAGKEWKPSRGKKNTPTQVEPGFFSSIIEKVKQLQTAISEVPAKKATGAVVEKQTKNEAEALPQRLQTESDLQKVAASTLKPLVPLKNNKNAIKEASPLEKASFLKHSAESKKPTNLSLSQPEPKKIAKETYPISSSSQASEEVLSQTDMTPLKMNALLSLKEQQTELAADIQKLQELTQQMKSSSQSKIVSLTLEQEEALDKMAYKQAQLKALGQMKATPNLGEFYQTFVINIEALCLAIKTAQTNLMKVELQGTSGKVAQVTQVVGSFLEAIPVIGNTAKSVSNVATKVLTKFDERLITQKLKQLHELGTQKQWQTFILELAKFLTLRYEDQLVRLLPTPTETAPDSPARALANYVVMSLFDHLMSYPVSITSFFSSSKPVTLTFEKVRAEFLDKLAPRSQATLTELGLMLLTFLSKDTVLSRSGEKLSLQAILTKPGIRVGNTAFFDHDLSKLTNAVQYGYRLGTEQEALQYKLIQSTNKTPHLSAAKVSVTVSSSMPNPSTSERKEQEGEVSVEVTATTLPKPTLSTLKQESAQTTDLQQQMLQRLEALEKANQEKDKKIEWLEQQRNQSSPSSWVGRVQDVPVGTQVLQKKDELQSKANDSAAPRVQASEVTFLEKRVLYTEQELSHLKESIEVVTNIALGIRTSSVIQQSTASASQKGTSPSK